MTGGDAAGGQVQGARKRQEDAWHLERFGPRELLAVLADGLGGHPAGDVASREGVAEVKRQFIQRHKDGHGSPRDWLRESILFADQHLHAMQMANLAVHGMATTLVALYIRDGEFWAASVGDSYLLLHRQNRLIVLNELHSEGGGVTSCVGFNLTRVDLADRLLVEQGDRFLLASDGLATLDAQEVTGLLVNAADAAEAVKNLLGAIEEAAMPAQDNATVIAVFA